jgi:DNA-binding transcriptional LysR family regulator
MSARVGLVTPAGRDAGRSAWLGIELRHLAALSAVARTGSFRRAAEELGYVQSAISQQVAFLERALGVSVLERSRGVGPARLTPAGALVVEHAGVVAGELRAARAELTAIAQGRAGVLRIGVLSGLPPGGLAALLRAFAHAFPDIATPLIESRSDEELTQHVTHGALDVAFTYLPLPEPALDCRPLSRERYVLVVPATSPLTADGVGALAQLELTQVKGRDTTGLEAQLRSAGIRPVIVREADTPMAAQALVGAGVGAAFLPATNVDRDDAGVRALEIGTLLRPRTLALSWRAGAEAESPLRGLIAIAQRVFRGGTAT